jgi:hypothetical protein
LLSFSGCFRGEVQKRFFDEFFVRLWVVQKNMFLGFIAYDVWEQSEKTEGD